jgi:hypothetical protein
MTMSLYQFIQNIQFQLMIFREVNNEIERIYPKFEASSNGGGNGYDYVVVPIHTKYTISIDDI